MRRNVVHLWSGIGLALCAVAVVLASVGTPETKTTPFAQGRMSETLVVSGASSYFAIGSVANVSCDAITGVYSGPNYDGAYLDWYVAEFHQAARGVWELGWRSTFDLHRDFGIESSLDPDLHLDKPTCAAANTSYLYVAGTSMLENGETPAAGIEHLVVARFPVIQSANPDRCLALADRVFVLDFGEHVPSRAVSIAVSSAGDVFVLGSRTTAGTGEDMVSLRLPPDLASDDLVETVFNSGGSATDVPKHGIWKGNAWTIVGHTGHTVHVRRYNGNLGLVGAYQQTFDYPFESVACDIDSSGRTWVTGSIVYDDASKRRELAVIALNAQLGYLAHSEQENLGTDDYALGIVVNQGVTGYASVGGWSDSGSSSVWRLSRWQLAQVNGQWSVSQVAGVTYDEASSNNLAGFGLTHYNQAVMTGTWGGGFRLVQYGLVNGAYVLDGVVQLDGSTLS